MGGGVTSPRVGCSTRCFSIAPIAVAFNVWFYFRVEGPLRAFSLFWVWAFVTILVNDRAVRLSPHVAAGRAQCLVGHPQRRTVDRPSPALLAAHVLFDLVLLTLSTALTLPLLILAPSMLSLCGNLALVGLLQEMGMGPGATGDEQYVSWLERLSFFLPCGRQNDQSCRGEIAQPRLSKQAPPTHQTPRVRHACTGLTAYSSASNVQIMVSAEAAVRLPEVAAPGHLVNVAELARDRGAALIVRVAVNFTRSTPLTSNATPGQRGCDFGRQPLADVIGADRVADLPHPRAVACMQPTPAHDQSLFPVEDAVDIVPVQIELAAEGAQERHLLRQGLGFVLGPRHPRA